MTIRSAMAMEVSRSPTTYVLTLLILLGIAKSVQGEPLLRGPYRVTRWNYKIDTLHPSDASAEVIFPSQILTSDEDDQKFPLLIFAHGKHAGGNSIFMQTPMLEIVASHGYIVTAHRSCSSGCDRYYLESLKMIQWAQDMSDNKVMRFVDHDLGYGLYGFSMGGQATAEALRYADQFNIKTGLLLHPGNFELAELEGKLNITRPIAAFTGTKDDCCGTENLYKYYDEAPSPKIMAILDGANHMEPVFGFRWQPYIAAWFKILLENDDDYYYNLILGDDYDSICGGFNAMSECEIEIPYEEDPSRVELP